MDGWFNIPCMKFSPQPFTLRLIAGLSIAFFGMIIFWVITPALPFGEKQFWDLPGEVHFNMMRALALVAGIVAGWRHWVAPFFVASAALLGQSLYLIATGWGEPLLIVGLFIQLIFLPQLLIPAAIGMAISLVAEWIAQRFAPRVETL